MKTCYDASCPRAGRARKEATSGLTEVLAANADIHWEAGAQLLDAAKTPGRVIEAENVSRDNRPRPLDRPSLLQRRHSPVRARHGGARGCPQDGRPRGPDDAWLLTTTAESCGSGMRRRPHHLGQLTLRREREGKRA